MIKENDVGKGRRLSKKKKGWGETKDRGKRDESLVGISIWTEEGTGPEI